MIFLPGSGEKGVEMFLIEIREPKKSVSNKIKGLIGLHARGRNRSPGACGGPIFLGHFDEIR